MNGHLQEYSAKSFTALVRDALSEIPDNQEIANQYLDVNIRLKRYVIGKNDQSVAIAQLLNLDGVVDDYAKGQDQWRGIPVVKTADLPADAVVVNCSTSISPVSVANNLRHYKIKNIINFNELVYASKGKLDWPWFVLQHREDYENNSYEWASLFEKLEDIASKKTLLDVVRYRLTADLKYMRKYEVRLNDQYFEDFMGYKEETFVDAGGFDGDTTEEFCKRYPDYRKVYIFEPSSKNMNAAKQRLIAAKNIEYFQLGLSDNEGQLNFDPDAGSASSVSDTGNQTVAVTTLDNVVSGKVSFIKMDLEGWEMKALAGCRRHIIEDKPKLAISVYHAASDFRDVPNYVLTLNPGYKIYIRHYTQGWSETVMYFR